MSDVSGPGIATLGLPYLTGYPLVESGLYALAKTWPAPEMPRPGCVWTHTLLIGFTDLAALVSPSVIAELFQRPQTNVPLEDYGRDVIVKHQESLLSQLLSPEASSWFSRLASGLYEHPDAQIWARRTDGGDVDDAVLRLWDQQWPRLKRSFRFCTLTSRDRSQEGMPFDLQLLPASESSSHLRFSSTLEGFEATSKSTGPWLEDLLHDAQFPNASTLRQFLRRLGADMLGGREAMRPFCSLHADLRPTSAEGVSSAVQRLEASPLLSASQLVKTIVAQAVISNLESADEYLLDFVIDNFPLLPEVRIREHQDNLAQLLWERDPRRLIALGSDPRTDVREAIRVGARSIPGVAVVRQLMQVRDLAEPLLELVPVTAAEPAFWFHSQLLPTCAARAGIELSDQSVLRAMILGLWEPSAIQLALQAVGAFAVLESLQGIVNSLNCDDQARHWLQYTCADTNAVAQFLARPVSPSRKLLLLLAEIAQPDAVPNDLGTDPWYLALQALLSSEGELPIELQLYGFQRGLGKRSRSVEQLLKLTFEPLHAAAEKNTLPQDLWHLLESSLPWASVGQEWDHAIRLRRAVAKKCQDIQLHAEGLLHLVKSDQLFSQLLDEIWELWGGARYLRAMSDVLAGSNAERNSRRARLFRSFMKEHSKLW